jgi:G3E family GTPase
MKVLSISGTQGSGKTTLIRELIAQMSAKGRRSAVIVNDDGEKDFDQDFIQSHGLAVEYIRGG